MWSMSDQWWKLCTERWYGNNLSGDTGSGCYRSGFPCVLLHLDFFDEAHTGPDICITVFVTQQEIFLLYAGAAPEEQYMQIMLDSYRQYIFCFEGNEDGGYVMACGMNVPTDVKGTEYIQQAYEMGKSIWKKFN